MAGLFAGLVFIISIVQVQGFPSNLPPLHQSNASFTCPKGEFVVTSSDGSPKCQQCPPDTFIDRENHTYEACKPCTKYLKTVDHVTETEECTRWSDTKIKRCEQGYFIENTTIVNCRCCVDPDSEDYLPSTQTAETQNSLSSETVTQNNSTFTPFNISCTEVVVRVNGCMTDEYANEQCMHNASVLKNATLCQKCPSSSNNGNLQCGPITNDYNLIISLVVLGIVIPIILVLIAYCIIKRRNKKERPVYQAVYKA